jgi:hypothetical protein
VADRIGQGEKGIIAGEKPDCFVGFDENPKASKPPRNDKADSFK